MTKRTREAADRLIADGLAPLDYMLGVMRGQVDFDKDRFEAAKAAAPYVHAKLVSSKVEGKVELSLGDILDGIWAKKPREKAPIDA